jgi:hypothetical protein
VLAHTETSKVDAGRWASKHSPRMLIYSYAAAVRIEDSFQG